MTLSAGTRVGPYEITAAIGAGGMGEVWRASDAKLMREVAIKVLPQAFTQDADRLARFEREAQLLAQLNHPNVAHVYGFESVRLPDGATTHFLAMELVEGEDLAERLKRGPFPVDEALGIAKQIAEALEQAHEKGIVHRDLKPANVKVTPDGKVKVLDFGLAKAYAGEAAARSAPDLTQSPTLAQTGTAAGLILGTAAYMSPEQARGKPVDKRADIWAFGVVLWEMLTGRPLFSGETVSDVLASVLTREPDGTTLPASTPGAVRQLLRRCLDRDPRNRLHDVADARIVLQEALAGGPDAGAETRDEDGSPSPRPRARAVGLAAAFVVVAVGAGLLGALAGRRPTAVEAPLLLSLDLAPTQELAVGGNATVTFSPDGRSLVFGGRERGRQLLFRRELGRREAEAIPGTEGGEAPFFSPDGRWLGFVSGSQMMKVAAEGGRPFRLGEQRGAGGSAWLHDGTIVYAPIYSDGLFRVSADGGTPKRLTTPDRAGGELGHWWPDPLPGDRQVLFTAFRTPVDTSRVGLLDLATGTVRWVVEGGFYARYVAGGHLVFARGGRLYAQPFDAASGATTGPGVAVLDDVLVSQTSGYATYAVSDRGLLAYVTTAVGTPPTQLTWLDRSGRPTPALPDRRLYRSVRLSPDGKQAALTIQGDSQDLWMASLERGTLSRLTSSEKTEFDPTWSPDGRELFYVVDRPPFQLHRTGAGSPDSGRPIWDETPTRDTVGVVVSPDGRTAAYDVTNEATGKDLLLRPVDGSAQARPIRATKAEERFVSFSPDGSWVAYQSNETGRPEVYVEPLAGAGERVQVSRDGGSDPLWARNGEVFYRHDDEVRVVPARSGAHAAFGEPRTLFSFPVVPGTLFQSRTYDVTADGSRILAVTMPPETRPRKIEVVTGWTAELPRLAPRGSR